MKNKENKKKRKNKDNKEKKQGVNKQNRILLICLSVLLVLTSISVYMRTIPSETTMTYTEFQEKMENKEIENIILINGADVFTIELKDGTTYDITNPGHEEFKKELLESGINIESARASKSDAVTTIINTLPTFVLMIFMFIMVTRMSFGGGNSFSLVDKGETKFDDVAGMDDIKKEVQFVVDTLKNYEQLHKAGGRPCKGIILEGPPGTGKTLLAKAIAGEAGVPFISVSGSDFIEMFVGIGASRVRSLWKMAKEHAPCVVFIDEIDAIGSRRTSGTSGGGTAENNQTINAILQRMDGLSGDSGILVVAATNRIDDLDEALLRPGRFDKRLYVGPPKTKKDRDAIIAVHMRNKHTAENIDMDKVSKLMFGLSGAEIESGLNEAVMISIQKGREGVITVDDIDEAVMKLCVSGVIVNNFSESDREVAAIHEAGHAITTLLLGRKVAKVSIVAYSSGVGGVTVEDMEDTTKQFKTHTDFMNDLKILFSGAVAEKLILGEHSLGWQNDLERATIICDKMLHRYGLCGDTLVCTEALRKTGTVSIDNEREKERINTMLHTVYLETEEILKQRIEDIKVLRDRLLEEETVLDVKLLENRQSEDRPHKIETDTNKEESIPYKKEVCVQGNGHNAQNKTAIKSQGVHNTMIRPEMRCKSHNRHNKHHISLSSIIDKTFRK